MSMLPRLQAEESLHRAAEISVGSGTLKTEARRRIVNEWLRLVGRDGRKKKLPLEHQKIILESMGVKLECRKN